MMIQNVVINKKSHNDYYLVNSWCKDESNSYFVPLNLNVLVKYSEDKQQSEWIRPIIKTNQEKFALYSDIKKYKNKLFFIPLHDTKIVSYDLKAEKFEWISIPHSEHWNCTWGNFSKAYSDGQKLYLVGYRYPGIVCLDMETKQCEQVLDIYSLDNTDLDNKSIAWESVEKDGKIYLFISGTNQLVKYDMKCNESFVYQLKNDGIGIYKTIAYDGDNFWFTSNGAEYLKWNEEKQEREIFIHPEKDKISKDNLFRYSFYNEGKLYILSSKESPIVVIDCNDFKQSKLIWKDKKQMKGYSVDYLYGNGQEWTFIDMEDMSNKVLNTKMDEVIDMGWIKDKEKIIQMLFKDKKNIIIKEGGISLIEFINM